MLLFPMLLLLLNVPTKNFSEKMVCSIEPQTNNVTQFGCGLQSSSHRLETEYS